MSQHEYAWSTREVLLDEFQRTAARIEVLRWPHRGLEITGGATGAGETSAAIGETVSAAAAHRHSAVTVTYTNAATADRVKGYATSRHRGRALALPGTPLGR